MSANKKFTVSYSQRWDSNGTHFDQCIRISKDTFFEFSEMIKKEKENNFPNSEEYLQDGFPEYLSIENMERRKNLIFMKLTLTRFLSFSFGLNLKQRNTYLKIK